MKRIVSASFWSVSATTVGDDGAYCCWWPQGLSPSECESTCQTRDHSAAKDTCGSPAVWCEPIPPTPPPPSPPPPTPTPSPVPPTPTPTGCPGGSLSACIELCPSEPAAVFQACVNVCANDCGDVPSPVPNPSPIPTPTPATPTPTPLPSPPVGGPWDFTKFESDASAFCSNYQAFDQGAAFICAGGGPDGGGGSCDRSACSNGQYSFPGGNTWKITTPANLANSGNPYRAFAYLPIVTQQLQQDGKLSIAFDMTIDGYIAGWHRNRVLILFYGDGSDKAFLDLTGDGLRIWEGEKTMPIRDGQIYSIRIDMVIGGQVTVTVADPSSGSELMSSSRSCNGQCDTSDPWGLQLGTYFFHYQSQNPEGDLSMTIRALRIVEGDTHVATVDALV